MKQIKSTLLILTLCALVFSSCKKAVPIQRFPQAFHLKLTELRKAQQT
jgi:hypothetical protein